MSTSLECRLLCASVTTYSVLNDGPIVPPPPPYFDAAQFVDDPPVGFVGGIEAINACLVGTTIDGVVLAFRGTLPPTSPDYEQTTRDWINDLDAELVRGNGVPGLVHAGFWGSLGSLWAAVVPEVQKRLTKNAPNSQLFITGHSKGGAMANLAAMRLLIERGVEAKVYTYAGPHPGNEDFAAAYNQHVNGVRYEYADDIVPLLPPSLAFREMFEHVPFMVPYLHRFDLDYSAVGTLRYITKAGNVVPASPMLPFQRYLSLAELIVTSRFAEIVEDHSSECGAGYMTAVCPHDVCA